MQKGTIAQPSGYGRGGEPGEITGGRVRRTIPTISSPSTAGWFSRSTSSPESFAGGHRHKEGRHVAAENGPDMHSMNIKWIVGRKARGHLLDRSRLEIRLRVPPFATRRRLRDPAWVVSAGAASVARRSGASAEPILIDQP